MDFFKLPIPFAKDKSFSSEEFVTYFSCLSFFCYPIVSKLLDSPLGVEFNNCPGAGIIVYHHFPSELLKVLEKLAAKL
jgi:hypothetical protein